MDRENERELEQEDEKLEELMGHIGMCYIRYTSCLFYNFIYSLFS